MKRSEVFFGVLRLPLDAAAVLLALVAAYRLREANIDLLPGIQLLTPATTLPAFSVYLEGFVFWSIILFLILAAGLKLYILQVTLSAWREVGRILIASLLWLAIIIAWFFLVEKQLFFSRMMLVHATVLTALFVLVERSLLLASQRALLKRGIGVRRVMSYGANQLPTSMLHTLNRDHRYRYIGHASDRTAVLRAHGKDMLDLVLHTDAHPQSRDTIELIDTCRNHHIGYAFLPPVFADVPHQLFIYRLGMVPILKFQPTPLDGWGRVLKRAFDIAGSIVLLIMLAVPLVIIALIVLITSGLPVMYVSRRVGQHTRGSIPVLKFRTMMRDADTKLDALRHLNHRSDSPLFKIHNDPRVTPLGRVLRRFSLDELPQLLNVLAGQMSLVGPRPHLPSEVARYHDAQRRVFAVKPGMTGIAQISGRSDLPFEDEVRLDMRYVEEWSLMLDLWILWRTLIVVLRGKGAD